MSTRNKMAVICQDGASNARRVSRALHEAVEECAAEGVDHDKDPAVFLICHQLTYLLTGHDFVAGHGGSLQKRYDEAIAVVTLNQGA